MMRWLRPQVNKFRTTFSGFFSAQLNGCDRRMAHKNIRPFLAFTNAQHSRACASVKSRRPNYQRQLVPIARRTSSQLTATIGRYV
jgi:hypothetical protein